MKKITLSVLLFGTLLFLGCKSETGRHNIQYIRPVEDTVSYDDFDKNEDEWKEDPLIDVGRLPEQEDFERMRHSNDDEMERVLMGK